MTRAALSGRGWLLLLFSMEITVIVVILGRRRLWVGKALPIGVSLHVCTMRRVSSVQTPASGFSALCFLRVVTHPRGESAPASRSFPGSPPSEQLGRPGACSPALCWGNQQRRKAPLPSASVTRLCPHLSAPHLLCCLRQSSRPARSSGARGRSPFHPSTSR